MSFKSLREFNTFSKSVADQLKKDGLPIQSFTDDHGNTITGWILRHRKPAPETNYLSGDGWREVWGRYLDVLTVDGEIYQYDEYNKDEQVSRITEVRRVRMKSLRKWPDTYLVGAEGKPFSKITAELERFRLTGAATYA